VCRSAKKEREALSRALAASQREAAANADSDNASSYMADSFLTDDDEFENDDHLSGAEEQVVVAEV
jgi:hypothetical protein